MSEASPEFRTYAGIEGKPDEGLGLENAKETPEKKSTKSTAKKTAAKKTASKGK